MSHELNLYCGDCQIWVRILNTIYLELNLELQEHLAAYKLQVSFGWVALFSCGVAIIHSSLETNKEGCHPMNPHKFKVGLKNYSDSGCVYSSLFDIQERAQLDLKP